MESIELDKPIGEDEFVRQARRAGSDPVTGGDESPIQTRSRFDGAGNSRRGAYDIGTLDGNEYYNDWVGRGDRKDFYEFRVDNKGRVEIDLSGLDDDADLYLHNSRGKTIKKSRRSGSASESISRVLNPGNYYVQVKSWSRWDSTYYDLEFNFTELSPDYAGNNRRKARDLGSLDSTQSYSDFVGRGDRLDFYTFTLDGERDVDISLDGLSANADLHLFKKGTRGAVGRSANSGSSSESINKPLDAGTYYLRVKSKGGSGSDYNLSFEAVEPEPEPVAVQPTPEPEPEPVAVQPTPEPEPVAVQPTVTSIPQPVAVPPTPTLEPEPEPVAVQPTPTPIPQPVAVPPTPTLEPEPEPVAVQPTVTSIPQPVAVQPTATVELEPEPVLVVSAGLEPEDEAGNSTSSAEYLGIHAGRREHEGYVSSNDPDDFYRFQVEYGGDLQLGLKNLAADADLELLNSSGAVLASSSESGTNDEYISYNGPLAPNTDYFVRVYGYNGSNTDYNLILNSDQAGEDMNTALQLGDLGGDRVEITEFLGKEKTDEFDYFKFNVDRPRWLRYGTRDLSADIDVEILDASGNAIAINEFRDESGFEEYADYKVTAGTYYAKVTAPSNASEHTNYKLVLNLQEELAIEETASAGTDSNDEWTSYTVKSGETLWDIALRTTGDGNRYWEIASYNSIDHPSLIYAGQQIEIPSNNFTGTTVEVTTGSSSQTNYSGEEEFVEVTTGGSSETNYGEGVEFIEMFAAPHSREVDIYPKIHLVQQDYPDSYDITLDRIGGHGYIQNNLETWIVIHGWNDSAGTFSELASAIESSGDGNRQVLTLDWSGMASTGTFDEANSLNDAAIWIEEVAEATVEQLNEWGFDPLRVNLAGHSLGAYVAYEISEQLGGVNNLIALDTAATTFGGYNDDVNFSEFSEFSWGFYSSILGHEDFTKTADESFRFDWDGLIDFDPIPSHKNVVPALSRMLQLNNEENAGNVSSLFNLNNMSFSASKPWTRHNGYEAILKPAENLSPNFLEYYKGGEWDSAWNWPDIWES